MAEGLLDPRTIRQLAAELDLRPTKQRGQNFVHDPNTVRRIVAAAGVDPGRRGARDRAGPRFADPRPAGGGSRGDRDRDRAQPRRPAAADRCRTAACVRRPTARARGRRAARRRAGRSAADAGGGEPALQRERARPAARARPLPRDPGRHGDGAGGGGRPAGGPAGLADLRDPFGEAGLVLRCPPGRQRAADRVLAGAQRRLRAGRARPARAAGHDRHPRGGVRDHRRRVRATPQDAACGLVRAVRVVRCRVGGADLRRYRSAGAWRGPHRHRLREDC